MWQEVVWSDRTCEISHLFLTIFPNTESTLRLGLLTPVNVFLSADPNERARHRKRSMSWSQLRAGTMVLSHASKFHIWFQADSVSYVASAGLTKCLGVSTQVLWSIRKDTRRREIRLFIVLANVDITVVFLSVRLMLDCRSLHRSNSELRSFVSSDMSNAQFPIWTSSGPQWTWFWCCIHIVPCVRVSFEIRHITGWKSFSTVLVRDNDVNFFINEISRSGCSAGSFARNLREIQL